jgi:hypothetical protein
MAIDKKSFTNADLNVSNQLVYTHNLSTQEIIPVLYDNNGTMYPLADIFTFGDESQNDPNNKVTVSFPDAITGTWNLLLQYTEAGATTTGRRAFELSTTDDPDDDYRIVIGKELTPSINMLLSAFVAWLLTKLGFLKISNNLSDLSDTSTARDNLGVYSKTAVNTALTAKADLRQTGSGAALGESNTSVYVPSSNYNPATKLYVDNSSAGVIVTMEGWVGDHYIEYLAKGSYVIGDVDGSGTWTGNISLGVTLTDADYNVFGEIYDDTGNISYWTIKAKTTTYFTLVVGVRDNSYVQNITFNWRVVPQ